jgi:hypothetical protein
MEKLPACSVAAGRPILTQTIILDMSGLSPLKHFTLTVQKFLHTLSQVDQVRGGGATSAGGLAGSRTAEKSATITPLVFAVAC